MCLWICWWTLDLVLLSLTLSATKGLHQRSHYSLTKPRCNPMEQARHCPFRGEIQTTIESWQKIIAAAFYVVDAGQMPLLSYKTAKEFRIIKITLSAIHAEVAAQDTVHEWIHNAYRQIFRGIGKLLDYQVHLHVPRLSHTFPPKEKVEAELDEHQDIIHPGYPWHSQRQWW